MIGFYCIFAIVMMRKLTTYFAAVLVLLTLPVTVSAQYIRGDSISDNPMYFRLFMPMTLYRSAVSEAISPEQAKEAENDSLLPIKPLDLGYDNTLAKMIDETLMKIYLEHPELVEMTESELMDVPGVLPISEDIASGIQLKDNRTGYGPASVSPERVDSKLRYWKTFGNFQGKYTQSYYSDNWYKGGESNHSILGQINLEADYAKNQTTWDNKLELKLGYYNSLLSRRTDVSSRSSLWCIYTSCSRSGRARNRFRRASRLFRWRSSRCESCDNSSRYIGCKGAATIRGSRNVSCYIPQTPSGMYLLHSFRK